MNYFSFKTENIHRLRNIVVMKHETYSLHGPFLLITDLNKSFHFLH